LEWLDEYESVHAAARAFGPHVVVHHETLRIWIKKALGRVRPSGGVTPTLIAAHPTTR
jgi:transposase